MKSIIFSTIFLVFFINSNSQTHRDSVDIHHYELTLDMTSALSGTITGKAQLKLTLRDPANSFMLDLYKLTTDSILINESLTQFSYTDSTLRIYLATLSNSDTIKATIYYHGTPKKDPDWGGFFYDATMAYNIGVGMGSYPHGIGRFWYPCNDAFTDRATYDYYIETRESEIGIASGLLVNESINNGNNFYHWHLAQSIPTYLSSIVIGPFIKITDTYSGIEKDIPIEIYTLKDDSAATTVTFNKLKETLSTFENSFGPYRWDKIGYSVVSFGSGAMEHATNIAYPSKLLNDNMSARTLVAHELAHHWFGNLVTCSQSTDMWLNEGWASYCESIFKEVVYSPESGLTHTLNNQLSAIKTAHLADGGYFTLNQIPHNITYGSTVYDKGALVVHCLRGYLGDELFFSGIKEFLNQNQYKSISSHYLQEELSKITRVDLTGFFENWVYQPGFPHYSINYFDVEEASENYNIDIELRQKLKAREVFSDQNRLALRFIDSEYSYFDTVLSFNGEKEIFNLSIPINPVAIFTDPNHQVLDVITDDIHTITETGYTTYSNCDFKLNTLEIEDSALIRVQYNWINADDFVTPKNGLHITNYHYWKIEGIIPPDLKAEGKFSFNFSTHTNAESDYNPSENDTLVLVYREDARKNWSVVQKGDAAKIKTGYIWTDKISSGEYALAYWDGQTPIGIIQKNQELLKPYIYPNPFQDKVNICMQTPFKGTIEITDMTGAKLFEKLIDSKSEFSIDTSNLPKGLLLLFAYGNYNLVTKAIKTN